MQTVFIRKYHEDVSVVKKSVVLAGVRAQTRSEFYNLAFHVRQFVHDDTVKLASTYRFQYSLLCDRQRPLDLSRYGNNSTNTPLFLDGKLHD